MYKDRKEAKRLQKERHVKFRNNNKEKRAKQTANWRALCPSKTEEFLTARKLRVLSHYGKERNAQCCWEGCEVLDLDMLSLDHVNNDGAKDRNIRGSGHMLYASVEKEGFPEGFQTLCHNHQWKKEITRRREARREKLAKQAAIILQSLESSQGLQDGGDNT